ncbi:MAG: hypothetical protein MPK11_02310 [Gammaproteobacteria bacterium]|nr:hypothetical protein [Gammaproteobacteria bacterium]MDA7971537.1 hypothetical protein [Gammaproteobacteria bacterium]MDA7995082.1 hypothetical protein [Gammaproteobacteria bacterium]CAJ2376461.1 MAG: conserved membrane hypothetical protein [Arenicellales bacterium IbO2]
MKRIARRFRNFVRMHWRGETRLARAFWVNFLLLWIALTFFERFLFPPFLHGETRVTAAAAVYFVFARLLVYPWQVVGVIRACERRIAARADRTWTVAALGVVVLSIAATLAAGFSSYQNLLAFRTEAHADTNSDADILAPKYLLRLSADGELLHLRGPFEAGITRRVEALLDAHPRVRGIALDSGGGQIYEGRGLARLIRERGLATYALRECASSCATAFVAGRRRALGAGAKLGFHQYEAHTVLPAFDVGEEQAKDMELFRAQGVSAEFLRKIFSQPPERMWWPSEEELRAAGVVHQTGFVPDDRQN